MGLRVRLTNHLMIMKLCYLVATAGVLTVLALGGKVARAQPATSCDPEFMQAMDAKAWMGTDRAMVQTQNLLGKPDSVLEYSCFDQLVSLVGEIPADAFSDNEARWQLSTGGLPYISNVSTDIALQETVGIALFTYLFTNFGPRFLGDRTPVSPAAPPRSVGTYDCGALNYVWKQAKCLDFGEQWDDDSFARTDFDMFHDFGWFEGADPRNLPEHYKHCSPSGLWGTALDTAYNGSKALYTKTNEALFDPKAYGVEQARPAAGAQTDLYLRFIVPKDHPLSAKCVTIPTGVEIIRTQGSGKPTLTYKDGSCPNPQCYYNHGSETCQ